MTIFYKESKANMTSAVGKKGESNKVSNTKRLLEI